jgi:hypothetical protein
MPGRLGLSDRGLETGSSRGCTASSTGTAWQTARHCSCRTTRASSTDPGTSSADAQRLGMPLIVWAYPRGSAVEAKGGRSSFYAVDYAARTASELGADMVKVNFSKPTLRAGV